MSDFVLVAGTIVRGHDGNREFRTYGGSDFAAGVDSAPPDKIAGIERDLLGKLTGVLSLFELGFGPGQPLIMISCKIGADGAPSLPILNTIPRNSPDHTVAPRHYFHAASWTEEELSTLQRARGSS